MLDELVCPGRELTFLSGTDVNDKQLVCAHHADEFTIRRKLRRNPTRSRHLREGSVGARDIVKLAAEHDEDAAAIVGDLKGGEAAQGLTLPLAPGLFLGAEFLLSGF